MNTSDLPSEMPISRDLLDVESNKLKSIKNKLADLAERLPEKLPFPFSGIIAIEAEGLTSVTACHFPEQSAVSSDCPFNVLSVGKLFTAIAIMQLIEEKKFSLDTPLSNLLKPEELDLPLKPPYEEQKPLDLEKLKAHMEKITVAHLLSHTAGFTHRLAEEGVAEGESWANDKTIGTYEYSNYGYQLLARIIGKYSSEGNVSDHEAGFRNHIEKRIFEKADMASAIQEIHYPHQDLETKRFKVKDDHSLVQDLSPEPYPHGNGCWRMQINDLLMFGKALRTNQLISAHTLRTMQDRENPLGFR